MRRFAEPTRPITPPGRVLRAPTPHLPPAPTAEHPPVLRHQPVKSAPGADLIHRPLNGSPTFGTGRHGPNLGG